MALQTVTQDQLNADPQVQAIIKKWGGGGVLPIDVQMTQEIESYLQSQGYTIPDNYYVGAKGGLQENQGFDWKGAALMLGSAVIPALAAAGPATTAATETGANVAGGFDSTNTLPQGPTEPDTGGAFTSTNTPPSGPIDPGATSPLTGAPSGTPSSYNGLSNLLKAAGQGIGSSATASANNQLARNNAQTTQANDLETALMRMSALEQSQRNQAERGIYASDFLASGSHSPFDPTPPIPGAATTSSLKNLSTQGQSLLATPPQYGTSALPNPTSVFPNPATANQPSAYQNIATWLAPALGIAGNVPPSVYANLGSWLSGSNGSSPSSTPWWSTPPYV